MSVHRPLRERVLVPDIELPGVHFPGLDVAVHEDLQGLARFTRLGLILFLICIVFIGGLLMSINSAPRNTHEILNWEHSAENKTLSRYIPDMTQYATNTTYLYQPPAHALFESDYRLVPKDPVTLGDLVIALGEPSQADCLEIRTLAGRSMQWLCVRFHGGQIEGCAFFQEPVERLQPQTPIHSIYYFAADSVYGPDTGLPWKGFTFLSTYVCDE